MSENISNPVEKEQGVAWSAAEFVEHKKDTSWFLMLGGFTGALGVAVFFISGQEIIPAISVVVIVLILAVFATRKPDVKEYFVGEDGLYIGENYRSYTEFESFSIIHDGHFESIYMVPNSRFDNPLNLYFPEDKGEQIVDIIGKYVVYGDKNISFVERIMHRLRF